MSWGADSSARATVSSLFHGPFRSVSPSQSVQQVAQPRIGATKLPVFVGGQLGGRHGRESVSQVVQKPTVGLLDSLRICPTASMHPRAETLKSLWGRPVLHLLMYSGRRPGYSGPFRLLNFGFG